MIQLALQFPHAHGVVVVRDVPSDARSILRHVCEETSPPIAKRKSPPEQQERPIDQRETTPATAANQELASLGNLGQQVVRAGSKPIVFDGSLANPLDRLDKIVDSKERA